MDYEFQVAGQSIRLKPDDTLVGVRFREPAAKSMRAAVSRNRLGAPVFPDRVEVPEEKFTLLPTTPLPAGPGRLSMASRQLASDPEVVRVTPVFRYGDRRVLATDRIVVSAKGGLDQARELADRRGWTIVREAEDSAVIALKENEDPLEEARKLAADESIAWAEPDFVTISRHMPRRAPSSAQPQSDPLAEGQYVLDRIRAYEAWSLARPGRDVVVAIIDEGVDTTHPDLRAAIVASYDASDDDAWQEPNRNDAHGTACAGIAGADHDNDIGIKGVAGGCGLMAIRIAYSLDSDPNRWVTRNSWIAAGIDWAWKNGASVLSNSWGGGTPSNQIVSAFERARRKGRDGKGCVITIAAGNDFGPVLFPANLKGVLCVSASNEDDEPKTPNSSDGERWGTCHGPEVACAAPGVHMLTTDIAGGNGYGRGDYYPLFNGTSSATPVVSAVAALVLAANPGLSEREVREIICRTADKVGSVPYANGRNDLMGFGRVNAFEAVRAALPKV
ncbi:MAG TPA: S8 family serine peptidase [Candidatus Omnitrophota bacterium]|nr:S8 family serine peptidase [Candidatus Omnitrophota bacterium]